MFKHFFRIIFNQPLWMQWVCNDKPQHFVRGSGVFMSVDSAWLDVELEFVIWSFSIRIDRRDGLDFLLSQLK